MDRCSKCLFELVEAELIGNPLRDDWYAFVYENVEPAITVYLGNALCINHAAERMLAEL